MYVCVYIYIYTYIYIYMYIWWAGVSKTSRDGGTFESKYFGKGREGGTRVLGS